MNIDKIKEFISMREELKAAGVIGVDIWSNNIHMDKEVLVNMPELQVIKRPHDDGSYPYKISTVVDGIKFFSISNNLETEFPQLAGYMEEDINFEGDENIA